MIDEIKCFDEPISNNIKTYENIQKISTGQGDGYQLIFCQIILISKNIIRFLSKEQALDINPNSIQQTNSVRNLEENGTKSIILEKVKQATWNFFQRIMRTLQSYFAFI